MRAVAGSATFHFDGRMLMHVGPTFLNVTIGADFPIGFAKHGFVASSMRAVTIRTLQETFGHTMVTRQRELGLDRAVARETQFGLRFP